MKCVIKPPEFLGFVALAFMNNKQEDKSTGTNKTSHKQKIKPFFIKYDFNCFTTQISAHKTINKQSSNLVFPYVHTSIIIYIFFLNICLHNNYFNIEFVFKKRDFLNFH